MKLLIYLIIILTCAPLYARNNKASSYEIKGVNGKILANVEKRMNELQQTKALSDLSQDELRYQILKALQPYGYFKANVAIQVLNSKKVDISIHSGPQVHITSLNIQLIGEGSQNPALMKVVHEAPLKVGDALFTDQYNHTKQNINNTAENQGYLHAYFKKAEILIDKNNDTAQITLVFDTGPLFYFGQVQFDPTYINPELLHRFVPFHPGQIYSSEQILKLNNDLSGSGYFNSVLVKPQISDKLSVPVLVHLEPASRYSYSLSAGYGTDTGIRGRAGLHIIPVNHQGHKFNALAQGSFTQNALQAQYLIPGRNPVEDQYSLTGNFSNLNYSSGYSNALLLSLAQQHHVDYFQRNLSINGLYESFHYTSQPNIDKLMLYPKASFVFSKTSSKLFSPSGYNLTLNGLGSSKALLSQINLAQASVDAKAAVRIDALRLRLYAHGLQGVNATSTVNQVPLTLALLLGGADNLKAYGFNSIGPGKILSYGGIEIQKEMKKNWYLLAFYDAGSVYNPTPRTVQYDVGAGLMWVSPVGPIKAGLAQAVNHQFQRAATNPRVVISMGPDL